MVKAPPVSEDDYVTEAWRHVMCYGCWFRIKGNVVLSQDQRRIVSVLMPPLRERIPATKVYMCCTCESPAAGGTYFIESPEGPFCEHLPNGQVRVIPTRPTRRKRVPTWL